jgi:hypothetical protein
MKKLIAVASAAVLLIFIAASAVGTPATRTPFEGFIHFCGGGPDEVFFVTPGGTEHFRGGINFNHWFTGNTFIDGPENNTSNGNFNPTSGAVNLDVTLEPYAHSGTWEIRQTLNFRGNGSFSGHGVGHGTGDLHGMTIKFTAAPPVPFNPADKPCFTDIPVSAPVSGVIISP